MEVVGAVSAVLSELREESHGNGDTGEVTVYNVDQYETLGLAMQSASSIQNETSPNPQIQLDQAAKDRLRKLHVDLLQHAFEINPKPTTQTKRTFAEAIGVDLTWVNNWFQNRRAKIKQERKQELYEAENEHDQEAELQPTVEIQDDSEMRMKQVSNTLKTSGSDRNPKDATIYRVESDGKNTLVSQKDFESVLEIEFWKNPVPTTQTKETIAKELNTTLDRVNNWFQNRRAKLTENPPEQEDISEAKSISPIVSSSPMSLEETSPGAEERIQSLFKTKDLQVSYARIHQVVGTKGLDDVLQCHFKVIGLSLRVEASGQLEKKTAGYVLDRARNLAHTISRTTGKGKKPVPPIYTTSEKDYRDEPEVEDELQAEDEDEDELFNFSHDEFLRAEQFILESRTLADSEEELQMFACELEEDQHRTSALESRKKVAIMKQNYMRWKKFVQVKWECSCRQVFSEVVIEYRPGAAQELIPFTSSAGDITVDIEQIAGSVDTTPGSQGTGHPMNNRPPENPQSVDNDLAAGLAEFRGNRTPKVVDEVEKDKEFILFCKQQDSEKTLHHADITTALCDYSSYNILHAKYYGIFRYPVLKWLNFKEISAVEFIKFHLFWGSHVSIDIKDIGVLPPSSLSAEYRYSHSPSTNIPVLKTALRHFIQHPSHAERRARDRPRIPKKVREELVLENGLTEREGYGLYIQERINWTKVCIVEALFATACVLFAVIWCVRHNGGIQDGFSIAGTGIAYATILLGVLQVISQRR